MESQVKPERAARSRLSLLVLSLLSSAIALAAPAKPAKVADALGHRHQGWLKAAPDIDAFPVSPDGTVPVIIQFKRAADHSAVFELATRLKRHLAIVNGEAPISQFGPWMIYCGDLKLHTQHLTVPIQRSGTMLPLR